MMNKRIYWVLGGLLAVAAAAIVLTDRRPQGASVAASSPENSPSSPGESLRRITVKNGFKLELIAAEPLLQSPVAIAYDENGNAFVAEMIDYPYTDPATHQPWKDNTTDAPAGRIRQLIDTDGDGVFDESHVFADGLSWPTGIACWKGGIYVTATPSVWYLKDTTGDHVADVRREVFTGFRKYNVQAVINNPIWGLDNHITISGSTNGGKIVSTRYPERAAIKIGRSDLRFDPRTELIEPISGGARFGNSFDDWGNRFIASPNSPGLHVVFDARVATRNRYLTLPNPVFAARHVDDFQPLFKISPPEPWRAIRTDVRKSENPAAQPSELVANGSFTSSSGITIYRGDAYPAEYRGQAFVAESANNIVHRMTVEPDGVTFRMRAADHDAEFVASPDNWFRPVNLINAPDGTLHIVDMHRETIEHPWAIPEKILAQVDLLSGRDRGRIYRLAPPGFTPPPPPRLGSASVDELVKTLEHPNSWWRETAQRLLFERQDRSAVSPLREIFRHSRSDLARAHALWTLEGLGDIEESDIVAAFEDPSAGVREQGVRIAALHLRDLPGLAHRVLELGGDESIRVRYQVAYLIGEIPGDASVAAAIEILRRDGGDRWVRAATLSAPTETCLRIALRLLVSGDWRSGEQGRQVMAELLFVLGAECDPPKLEKIVEAFSASDEFGVAELALWDGLGRGLKHARKTLTSAFKPGSTGARKAQQLVTTALEVAASSDRTPASRVASIRMLEHAAFADVRAPLGALLATHVPPSVQLAAIETVAKFSEPGVSELLLRDWARRTPQVREEILEALISRQDRVPDVLDAIEKNIIEVSQIGPTQRLQLLAGTDAETKQRAQRIFQGGASASAKDAFGKYDETLALRGDPARGVRVYQNLCAACHVYKGQGSDIGPNLETVRGWGSDQIILNIVDPNREVAPNYVTHVLEMKDGTTLSGMITEENDSSIKLKRIGAAEENVLRQNIVKITALPTSLMPPGLDSAISPQEMADLISYLQSQ